jgi:hypothetical protein
VQWHGVFGVMFGGEATVLRGHEGLLEYLRDVDEAFAERDVQWSEFRDLVIGSSSWGMCGAEAARAESTSTRPTLLWPCSRTASASALGTTSTTARPSKPLG